MHTASDGSMRWVTIAVLARFTLCAGLSRHTNYVTKNITDCPDVGYFFERVVRPNAIEPDCQLCFCKEGDIAICWRREGKRCQEKESKSLSRQRRTPVLSKLSKFFTNYFHHRRITPENSITAKPQSNPLPNKNLKCKPFTSVSKDCPPTDWCLGCTVCNCDRDGKWDCHTLSFCTDKNGEPIHTYNSLVESLHVEPNKSHIPHYVRNKRKPEMYLKRNPSQLSNTRKSSLVNRTPGSRIPENPTRSNSQKSPIQGKKEKLEPLGNMQQSLAKKSIVRPARQVARKPIISNKVPIKNTQRKFKISQTTTRIPPLNMNSSEVQIVLKTFIRNVRKVSEKNLIKKKPRIIGKVTQKTLKKITKPKFTSKSKAATMNKYRYNRRDGPCRADGQQDSCKPNNVTILEPPPFNVKNKIKQETPPIQNIRQSKTHKEQNERNIRARSRSNSKKPLLSKSDNLIKYTYQHSKSKEYIRKERASIIHKQEINGQKNVNQNMERIKNINTFHPVTGIAWKNLTNSAGVFDRRKRNLVNHTTSFEHKNITSTEKIQDNFEMHVSKEIVDEVINGSLNIGNSVKYNIYGDNLTSNFALQSNDNTDADSVKHMNTKKHSEMYNEPNQSTTEKIQEREIKVTEMENDKHVLITKDNDAVIENFMLFPARKETQKKIYNSSKDIRQSNLPYLSRDKHTDIRESKQTELQRTRRQNNRSNGTVPIYESNFSLLPLTIPPPTNFSLEGAIEELNRIGLDLKKSREDFESSQLLFNTNIEKLINKSLKNSNWMDKRINKDDIRSEELEQVIKKIKYLFRKDKLMQTAFLKDLYDVLNKFTYKITSLSATSKNYSNNTGLSREKEFEDIEFYTTIANNIKKIKILATNRGRRKREIRDEVSFDYLLMALEYLLKSSYNMANGSPVSDGIDILIDAIRSAPDIELTKRKLYSSQVAQTVPSKVAASTFRALTIPEERIAIDAYAPNQFEPRYLKESTRVKNDKEKMNIIEKELEKEISEAEPEKETTEKETARELPRKKFEKKVVERTQKPFIEIKNKTTLLNFFGIDEDEDEGDEDNYFRIMKRTSNPKSVTEASKFPEVINLNVYQEYRPTKDTKKQTGSESDQPHAASKNSNEEEPRRNNKGNVDENVSSNDSQVTLTQPATTEEPRKVPIRTEPPKTETKPTVRQFNWYKELDTNEEYEDKSKQGGNKLIWTEEDLDEQNKNTKNTRKTTLTTTQAYSEQTYPSIKRKKHKITPHKVMLKKEMNLLKSLEYDTEKEDDSDSNETRNIIFSLY